MFQRALGIVLFFFFIYLLYYNNNNNNFLFFGIGFFFYIFLTSMNQDEEELSYLNDFQEILQSEVYVDLERLRILARHGIPDQIRGVSSSII